jgi:hypothetical protein
MLLRGCLVDGHTKTKNMACRYSLPRPAGLLFLLSHTTGTGRRTPTGTKLTAQRRPGHGCCVRAGTTLTWTNMNELLVYFI